MTAMIEVGGRTVTVLDGPGLRRRYPVPLADVLWLTEAEQVVLGLAPLDAGSGLGAVLLPLLAHAARLAETVPSPGPRNGIERRQLGAIIRNLLSAAAAERVEAGLLDAELGPAGTPGITPQHVLVVRAMEIIHSRLDQPNLTSAAIAAQLRVSVRTLQSAFRSSSASVAQTVRALRLEREDLDVAVRPARPQSRTA